MAPADRISRILDEIKTLRQQRGYTLDNFYRIKREMQPFVENYRWNLDEFIAFVNKKNRLFRYRLVNKELKALRSLLKYINKLLKKKEFVAALEESKIDIEQLKKAINFNKLKLIVLENRNNECRKKWRKFRDLIKINAYKKEFEKALAEWDKAQMELAYLDRLEDKLESKAVDLARQYPAAVRQRMGIWKKATAYTLAVMIGFAAVTGSYSADRGFGVGGSVAMAGEVQHDKAFYDGLAEQSREFDAIKNPSAVIQFLDKYKDDSNNKSSDFFGQLGTAYVKSGRVDDGINMLEYGLELDKNNADIAWNLGCYYYTSKKNMPTSKKYFQRHINLNGQHKTKAQKYVDYFIKKGY